MALIFKHGSNAVGEAAKPCFLAPRWVFDGMGIYPWGHKKLSSNDGTITTLW